MSADEHPPAGDRWLETDAAGEAPDLPRLSEVPFIPPTTKKAGTSPDLLVADHQALAS